MFDVLALTPEDPAIAVKEMSVIVDDFTDEENEPASEQDRKKMLEQMAQPWTVAYIDLPENHFILERYYLGWVADALTFIGPDGKIIARSYYTDLEKTLKTIERTLSEIHPK
jgi:hypothetical protein